MVSHNTQEEKKKKEVARYCLIYAHFRNKYRRASPNMRLLATSHDMRGVRVCEKKPNFFFSVKK